MALTVAPAVTGIPGGVYRGTVQLVEIEATGGKAAEVREAMLMPGTIGVYLVKAVVPDGLETGTSTPLILTVDGQPSPPVTVATRHLPK